MVEYEEKNITKTNMHLLQKKKNTNYSIKKLIFKETLIQT